METREPASRRATVIKRCKGFRLRGASAVVVVVVAAVDCGLEVDEAAREGPGSGFSTVIRWVSSVPSRFQGGYCHESGVECMFSAARQSAFEWPEGPSPEDCFVCARRPVASGCVARWTGGGHTPQSPQSPQRQGTAVDSIPYTPQCACGTARGGQRPAQLGIRDRTIQGQNGSYGTLPARGFDFVDFVLSFSEPASFLAGLSLDSLDSGLHSQGTYGTRLAARRAEAAGRR